MSDTRAKGQVQADVPRLWWSAREFAAATGCAIDTVYRLMRKGGLAWEWIGGEKRIPNSEMERLLSGAEARRTA